MELKRVVVTGLGAITPLGKNVEETWQGLINGKSGCGPITLFDASKFKTQFACEVKDFDPLQFFDKKEVRKLDRYTQLAFAAVTEAIQDCGIDLETEDKNRIGVIYSAGIGGIKTFQDETGGYNAEIGPKYNPFFIPKMIADIAAGQISIHYGFHGPNYGTVSACASSTHGMIDAFNLLRLGKANIIVAGGAESAICEAGIGGFNAMRALSTRNDDFQTASRPLSAGRDGFVMGEGAGILVLEELEHARARSAKIYGEIIGDGLSADAYHITSPHPDGHGAAVAMQNALADAELHPEDIDYINMHATSTQMGDRVECLAIQQVFGEHANNMLFSSTKSMTGHLLGACGAVESIAVVLSLQNGILPPTINFIEKDPEIPDWNFCANKAVKRDIRYAINNAFGFGGHNVSILFKKFEE